jgi:hypothetical protein
MHVLDRPPRQAQLGVGQGHQPGPAIRLLGGPHAGRGPVERLFAEAVGMLNGLFTNDKFCWSRQARLHLTWWRRAYRDR